MFVQARVVAVQLDELIVFAFFDNLTFFNHQNVMCGPHRAQPMRDDKDSASLTDLCQVVLNDRF
jgi:hypothetical protein